MAKKERNPLETLKLKYNIARGLILALVVLIGVMAYSGYDYWVFKTLIASNYIYTDTLDELYTEMLGEQNFEPQNNKGYAKDFDRVVMAITTAVIRSRNNDRYTYLYTPENYAQSKTYEKEDAKLAAVTELTADTVSINLPNFSAGTKRFLFDNKETLSGYKNLIIDLRHNYGGLLADYYDMADLFLPKGTVIGYESARLPVFSNTIKAKSDPYFHFDSIIILQDENTASSAEGFIMALDQNMDNVTLVGTQTFGKGIGQVTIPLTGGYALKATVLSIETPDQSSIHGKGIPPDVSYDENLSESKDIMTYALELAEQP